MQKISQQKSEKGFAEIRWNFPHVSYILWHLRPFRKSVNMVRAFNFISEMFYADLYVIIAQWLSGVGHLVWISEMGGTYFGNKIFWLYVTLKIV